MKWQIRRALQRQIKEWIFSFW